MTIAETLLPEFDQEMANTRKVLERVPTDKLSFTPHAKSWDMAHLANHVAMLPNWGAETMKTDSIDYTNYEPPKVPQSAEEILAVFDKNVLAAREVLAGSGDDVYMGNWSLTANGVTYFTMPRIAVLRSFVMNHIIHHRAQLCVYLRLNDIPVPGLYGPSADDASM